MSALTKFARLAGLASSFTLLAAYVVYSHVTPNVPPPDPLGLSAKDVTLDAMVVPINSITGPGDSQLTAPQAKHSSSELRIITSKSISQPIFSTRKVSSAEAEGMFQARANRRIMFGSKSGAVELPMPEFLKVTFADFGISLEPFLGFPSPNDPFRGTSDTTVKAVANDPFGGPDSKP
ncbi:MAG: hypothetical protein R3F13_17840 [Prosthecobacter sp.]